MMRTQPFWVIRTGGPSRSAAWLVNHSAGACVCSGIDLATTRSATFTSSSCDAFSTRIFAQLSIQASLGDDSARVGKDGIR